MAKRVKAGDPGRAVGYVRASTSKQEMSTGDQGAALAAWVARQGATMDVVYFDKATTGTLSPLARAGFREAWEALQRERAGVLLVAKLDRLSRDATDQLVTLRDVRALGARVISAAGQGTENDDDAQVTRRNIDAVFSDYEVRAIRARTKHALAQKKARGELTGSAPLGSARGPDGKHLVPHEGERQAIAAARMLRERGLSLRAIGAELAALGHVARPRRDHDPRPYGAAQVARMLRAPVAF